MRKRKLPWKVKIGKGEVCFFWLLLILGRAQIFCFRENMMGIFLPEATKMWELLQK